MVEASSFTRAAETLGLPRSSVSAAVQELEGRLGARLLHRTTRKVSPTHDGAVLYERCLRLIDEMTEVEALFRADAHLAGKISVSLPERIARLIVAPLLPAFLARHEDIEIALGVTDRSVDLVEDGVDLALRIGEPLLSGLAARPLGALALISVASPAYLAAHGTPRAPADLARHWAVHFAPARMGRIDAWEWEEDGRVRRLPLRGRVSVDSAEAYIACCRAGLGVIQIPAYDVRDELARGELVEILPAFRPAPMPVALLYPQRRRQSRRVRVFADWLADVLREATGAG